MLVQSMTSLFLIDQISDAEDVETSLHIQLSQQPAASTLSPDEPRQQHHTNDTLEPSKGGFTRPILSAITVSAVYFRQNRQGVQTTDIRSRYLIIIRNQLLLRLRYHCDAITIRKM